MYEIEKNISNSFIHFKDFGGKFKLGYSMSGRFCSDFDRINLALFFQARTSNKVWQPKEISHTLYIFRYDLTNSGAVFLGNLLRLQFVYRTTLVHIK